MSLPATVHVFPFDAEFGERTMRLHPAGIETEAGLLLVDTGLPHAVDTILEGIAEAGYDAADIRLVLLTHQDGDHAGGLAGLLEHVDPIVIASRKTAAVVDGRAQPRVVPEKGRYPPARVDVEFDGEITINTAAGPARVLQTPGHTPDHVSVYLPEQKLLIAGDALGLYGDRLDAPEPAVTEDDERARESIGKLAQLDIDRILCYHGGLTDAGSERLAEIAAA